MINNLVNNFASTAQTLANSYAKENTKPLDKPQTPPTQPEAQKPDAQKPEVTPPTQKPEGNNPSQKPEVTPPTQKPDAQKPEVTPPTTGPGGTMPGDKPVDKEDKPSGGNALDNEAFMRLFLEQLKNQDPTAPMETQEILTQTAQLTQVEAQEKMKTAMEKMTSAMTSMQETNNKTIEAQEKLIESQKGMLESLKALADNIQTGNVLNGYNAIGVIGKVAETGYPYLEIEKNEPVKYNLYFDEKIDFSKGKPKITIMDEKKNIIKEFELDEKFNGKQGYIELEWDTKDKSGSYVKKGGYVITAEYNTDPSTNKPLKTEIGRGEVQSVMYEKGVPFIKLGDHFVVPIDLAHTFYPKKS